MSQPEIHNVESIIAVLKGLKGSTIDTVFDLFFTEKRMIAAIVLHPGDLAKEYSKPDITTLLVGGYFKQREIKVRSLQLIEERRATFDGKNPDEILSSHRANLQVEYENILFVKIKKGFLGTTLEFETQPPGRKIAFSIDATQLNETEQLMKKIFPEKTRQN